MSIDFQHHLLWTQQRSGDRRHNNQRYNDRNNDQEENLEEKDVTAPPDNLTLIDELKLTFLISI
jgi:hypothetical protein